MAFLTRKSLAIAIALAVFAVLLLAGFIRSGIYNVAADDPHTRPVHAAMQALREHSIRARSKSLVVPNLEDPELVLEGAGHYAAMCTGCHLAPGMADSEIRPGLYPQPPNLSEKTVDPRTAFWVIKHGIKMSAMPAWGLSHDDPTIWGMVAFLQQLPRLSPAQYRDIVARAPPDEDMEMDMDMPADSHHHDAGANATPPAHTDADAHEHAHDTE